jgi:hypothetical protein
MVRIGATRRDGGVYTSGQEVLPRDELRSLILLVGPI